MDLNLKNAHVMIGGGSRGIGFACAVEYAKEGAKLSVVGRNENRLAQCVEIIKQQVPEADIEFYVQDLAQSKEAEALVDQIESSRGPVDILVVTAGGASHSVNVNEISVDDWHQAMDAKFFTYINLITPVIKRMGARGQGSIVSVLGTGGRVPHANALPRGATSSALMLATAGLAKSYASMGVRINAVNPGYVLTLSHLADSMPMDQLLQRINLKEAEINRPASNSPMGRIGLPNEIANVVLFLSSPRASYITGSVITVDGGTSASV
jgi:NAD(P)-dependent dehydrogenase (short-subunit alcohol dehydrogenase family)